MEVLLNFWPTLTGPGRQSNEPFFCSIFLETRWSSVYIEPLINLLACLEPKLWPQKHFTPNSENCRKSMSLPLAACADSDNSPREHDRELFEPSRDSWGLAVCTEKKPWGLGLGFSVGVVKVGFSFMTSSPRQQAEIVSQVWLNSRLEYESLEP